MKKRLLALLLALGCPALVLAQNAIGYVQLTVTSAVVTIPASITGQAPTFCKGTLENQPIRVSWVGGAKPTQSAGQPVNVGDKVILGSRQDIANFQAVLSNAATGTASGLLSLSCVTNTPPTVSMIEPAAPVQATAATITTLPLPVCNALLKAAGTSCR